MEECQPMNGQVVFPCGRVQLLHAINSRQQPSDVTVNMQHLGSGF